jgi:galactokinase
MLAEHRDRLDDVIYRRCCHVVTEDQRVLECVDILKSGDLQALGERINASHRSLRDDYEVSCKELDVIAELAWETDGVYGARMVGAGFGGCVIAICDAEAVPALKARIETEYPRRCNLQPDVYATRAGDGAGEVT